MRAEKACSCLGGGAEAGQGGHDAGGRPQHPRAVATSACAGPGSPRLQRCERGVWRKARLGGARRRCSLAVPLAQMFETYGVEAGQATIIRELSAVFDVYGISVNHRHLSLVADYMVGVRCGGLG